MEIIFYLMKFQLQFITVELCFRPRTGDYFFISIKAAHQSMKETSFRPRTGGYFFIFFIYRQGKRSMEFKVSVPVLGIIFLSILQMHHIM